MSRSFTGTKKDAEARLAVLPTEVNTGGGGHKGSDATVAVLVEQWLDLRRWSLSVTTWEAYAAKARFRLIPALGDVAVRKLTVRTSMPSTVCSGASTDCPRRRSARSTMF